MQDYMLRDLKMVMSKFGMEYQIAVSKRSREHMMVRKLPVLHLQEMEKY